VATGWCLGCGRDIDEIAGWSSLSPAARRSVLDALPERMRQLEKRGQPFGPPA
jgi:predicted Fe-S protein YdhL (DUF1289 family)